MAKVTMGATRRGHGGGGPWRPRPLHDQLDVCGAASPAQDRDKPSTSPACPGLGTTAPRRDGDHPAPTAHTALRGPPDGAHSCSLFTEHTRPPAPWPALSSGPHTAWGTNCLGCETSTSPQVPSGSQPLWPSLSITLRLPRAHAPAVTLSALSPCAARAGPASSSPRGHTGPSKLPAFSHLNQDPSGSPQLRPESPVPGSCRLGAQNVRGLGRGMGGGSPLGAPDRDEEARGV